MKVFISWFIANFEGILFSAVLLTVSIFLFNNPPVKDDGIVMSSKGILELIALSTVFVAGLTLQTKSFAVGVVKYLLLLAFLIWGKGVIGELQLYINWTFAWGVFVGSSIIGIISAVYAFSNFDDVVSLRMLYRNSSVSLFDECWMYVIDRFTGFSISIFLNTYWLILIFKL